MIIWAVIMLGAVPKYATTNISWHKQPGRNISMLEFSYTPLMRQVEELTIQVMNVFIPFVIYLLVVVCTVILVVKLKQSQHWRSNHSKINATLPAKGSIPVVSISDASPFSHSSGRTKGSSDVCNAEGNKEAGNEFDKKSNEEIPHSPDALAVPHNGDSQAGVDVKICPSSNNKNVTKADNRKESIETKRATPGQAAISSGTRDTLPMKTSTRELKVLKNVVAICFIFLTCTSPTVILISIYLIWPTFHVDTPEFQNLMHLLISFPFLTQTVSSSINIIFYMRMSSRFRPVFLALFRSCSFRRFPRPARGQR